MFARPFHRNRDVFEASTHLDAAEDARRSNRRRLIVFLGIFLATLLPGLVWNLMRPAEYRATARIEILPGAATAPRADRKPADPATAETPRQLNDVLAQIQILNSRSLLEEVQGRLGIAGEADSIAELQSSIAVSPIPATDIVELQAVGPLPQRLAAVLNTLIEVYRDRLFAAHGSASRDTVMNLREETERLSATIADQRAKLATFRARTGVVSSERSENESLARIKGLSESLNKANEDAAKAEAKVRSLRESAAAGRNSGNAKDNPTLAAVEQRISATREQLRDMERTYTPDFMAMDPTARALRARLAELEQQVATTRSTNQQAALVAAEEEAAGARATVDRLRAQIAAQRREAQDFSGSFQQAQTMEDDLGRLETARRNAMERLARIEASAGERQPALRIIEAAGVPQQPWRPNYIRDALINLAASFVLGLLAMWFVELFNRAPPVAAPSTVVVPQPWIAPTLAMASPLAPPESLPGPRPGALPQLPAATAQARELSQEEAAALLAAADGGGRALCALLLLGLTAREICELTVGDVDPAGTTVSVRGASARTLGLPDWLARQLARNGDASALPLFRNAAGQALGDSEVAAQVTCAALDAGLDAAASISPADLRHTCIAWQVRQGVRFSDLAKLVGQLSAEELAAYAPLSADTQRPRGQAIAAIMPALLEAQTTTGA